MVDTVRGGASPAPSHAPNRRLGETTFSVAVFALDVAVIISLSVVTGAAYHVATYGLIGDVEKYLSMGGLIALLFTLPIIARQNYRIFDYGLDRRSLERIVLLWNFAFLCAAFIGFSLKATEIFSRGSVLLFYVVGLFGVLATRAYVARLVHKGLKTGDVTSREVLLVGTAWQIERFVTTHRPHEIGLGIADIVRLDDAPSSDNSSSERNASALEGAAAKARALGVDDVYILVPWSQTKLIDRCVAPFLSLPISIHLGPEAILDRYEDVRVSRIGTMTSLNLTKPPLSMSEIAAKRAFDIAVSLTGLVLLAPLFALIALAIKLDSRGPVFFLQRRHGFNQRQFRIFKFRTMTTLDDGAVIQQASKNDARVTRIGRILRRWNLDELPQLLNALIGDMSIVGPRPHAIAHDREFAESVAFYARRHNVKPGITGWAQINGLRGPTDTRDKIERRVQHDLYYIDNWSLFFDVYIMLMTILSPRSFKNAF